MPSQHTNKSLTACMPHRSHRISPCALGQCVCVCALCVCVCVCPVCVCLPPPACAVAHPDKSLDYFRAASASAPGDDFPLGKVKVAADPAAIASAIAAGPTVVFHGASWCGKCRMVSPVCSCECVRLCACMCVRERGCVDLWACECVSCVCVR